MSGGANETVRQAERDLRTFIAEVFFRYERISLTLYPIDRGVAGLQLGGVLVNGTFGPGQAAALLTSMAVDRSLNFKLFKFVVKATTIDNRRLSDFSFSLAPN